MNKEIVLACDLGGTNLRMAVVNAEGKILHFLKVATPKTERAAEIARVIVETANHCRSAVRHLGEVKALAAAVPATLNAAEGIILKAPNIPALDGFPFSSVVSNELNLPVILENDAIAAAIGEQAFGAAKGFENAVIVTLGTGVGGGIIINGNILRGIDGTAGEIGHICVEQFGAPCGCGSRGCVEQYSSASAIVRIAQELAAQYPESTLKNAAQLKASEVFQAGVNGDKLALEVFRQMGFYLGIALSSLINVLNPGVIVIGGGASAGWKLFMPQMRETIRQRAFGSLSEHTKIVRGELGDDAGILGAARLAFDDKNGSSPRA